MHFLTIFILLAISLPLVFLLVCRVFQALIKKKAIAMLDTTLFPQGLKQKQEVMNVCHNITNHRFRNEDILDYYYKIKGLKTLGLDCKRCYALKKYLFSPTTIKLNYFEQCQFYDTFLYCSKRKNLLNQVNPEKNDSHNNHFKHSNSSTEVRSQSASRKKSINKTQENYLLIL
ncbi:hypothetical protein BY457_109147 [Marinilabilia salmonicolor]|jgi:hypothetical protein|nr:hypothetical protein BY457_109147 [Marinilabilia salmonicolor]